MPADEPDLESSFHAALAQLVGEKCWSVIGGGPETWRLSLDFGTPIPREREVANPHLAPQQRHFAGRLSVFSMCAWRLEHDGAVLLTSESEVVHEERSCPAPFEAIIEKRVTAASVSEAPGRDLVLRFEGGASLHWFCDRLDFDNYDLFRDRAINARARAPSGR